MTRFKEIQMGWLVIVAMGMVLILITILFSLQLGTRPITTPVYLLVFGISGLALALTYRMQTEVTGDAVIIAFGVGIIRKKVLVDDVTSVREVTNPWYYGWGIRVIPNGWLYNMGGSKAVELQLHSGKVLRIGTKKQTELASVIKEQKTKRT